MNKSPRLTWIIAAHVATGILLICLDPILSALMGYQNAMVFSLRAFSPLVPCIGLVWVGIGATLLTGHRWAVLVGFICHLCAVVGNCLALGLGVVLLIASGSSHGHSVGAALFPAVVILLLLYVGAIGGSSAIVAFRLRRILKESPPDQTERVWSPVVLGLGGVLLFAAVGGLQSSYENQRRDLAQAKHAEQLKTVAHDKGEVKYLAFSPDGQSLTSAVEFSLFPDSVHLWNTQTGRLTKSIEAGAGVLSLQFGNGPDRLFVGLRNNEGNLGGPHLWDVKAHQTEFDGGLASVHDVAISPDGKFLVACANRGTWEKSQPTSFKIWNLDTGEPTYESLPNPGYVSAAFSPDGTWLATRRRSTVELWDFPISEGDVPTQVLDLGWFYSDVSQISFSADGKQIAAAASSGIKLWDVASGTGRELQVLPAHSPAHAIAFSHDRSRILFASEKSVWVIDWKKEEAVCGIQAAFDVTGVAISRDNNLIAVGGERRVQLFEDRTGAFLREFNRKMSP